MRVAVFVVAVFAVVGVVGAAAYFSAPYWLPAIYDAQGQIDREALGRVVVVVPAAVGALVTSLVAGVASLLVASYQRAANVDLETHKGDIVRDLDAKRSMLAKDLEQEKKLHSKELEDYKGKLATSLEEFRSKLVSRREQMDVELARLASAREVMILYRLAVSSLRVGGYLAGETKPLIPKLLLARDSFDRQSGLFAEWCVFMQLGHYLEERAEQLKPVGQRRLWSEISAKLGGVALGVAFAASCERVLSLLDEECRRVRSDF
jgi:hypothetical protein